jgi:hypothetical protein
LTVARHLARITGFALFHNHLVVDAVGAVFPFGTSPFVKLRERFWIEMLTEAAGAGRSVIFTFAPENTVAPGFAQRVESIVRGAGGEVCFVRFTVSDDEQERRIAGPSRARFEKLMSLDLLRELRPMFKAAEAAMPEPMLTIDTGSIGPEAAAKAIADALTQLSEP